MSAALIRSFSTWRRPVAVVGLLVGLMSVNVVQAQDEWQFEGVERVVAIADIHGAYEAFEKVLRRAELVDESLTWTGGETHLVIVGDVLDRGPESRLALDLIRKLEGQARATGGRVHLVLGNHEIMNLTGDLRYVSADEFAAFADQEPLAVRAAEFDRYVEALGLSTDLTAARGAFDAAYPLGFFAHRRAFAPGGEYGEWLRTKPALLVIDDVAFVHGGLVRAMVDHGNSLNARLSLELNGFLAAIDTLVSAGVLSQTVEVYDMPASASEYLERSASEGSHNADLDAAARRLLELNSMELFDPDGSLWYRGNVGCNRLTEQDRLSSALEIVGAEHLVVGHTPTASASVLSRMNEMLLRIDTGMLNEYYGGRASALIIEGGEFTAIYTDGSESLPPLEQPRRVGLRPDNLTAEELEGVLTLAEVGTSQRFDGTAELVTLVYRDFQFVGLFTRAEERGVLPEVAAYRLDRVLGIDMVPVTVAREIEGVPGAVQYLPASSISEAQRSEQQLGSSAWCPLGDQFSDMYLFDALIFNEARTLERIRYSTDNLQLLLLGHDQAFSTERTRPAYMENIPVELTAAWRDALNALNEENLSNALGDVLNRRRIRAILARRDVLLELAR